MDKTIQLNMLKILTHMAVGNHSRTPPGPRPHHPNPAGGGVNRNMTERFMQMAAVEAAPEVMETANEEIDDLLTVEVAGHNPSDALHQSPHSTFGKCHNCTRMFNFII